MQSNKPNFLVVSVLHPSPPPGIHPLSCSVVSLSLSRFLFLNTTSFSDARVIIFCLDPARCTPRIPPRSQPTFFHSRAVRIFAASYIFREDTSYLRSIYDSRRCRFCSHTVSGRLRLIGAFFPLPLLVSLQFTLSASYYASAYSVSLRETPRFISPRFNRRCFYYRLRSSAILVAVVIAVVVLVLLVFVSLPHAFFSPRLF